MMELWQACFFVLILDFTFGREVSNANYVVRVIESCPSVGYFFTREPSPNLVDEPCYLCFCKGNGTAGCWRRDNRRCDVENYHHNWLASKSRVRRSFSDVFLRDATRDFLGTQITQQCKPFKSSFSDGCPPEDWCVGCTICDCDATGHWDCHVLSFCDGKESKRKVKVPKQYRKKKDKNSFDNDYDIHERPVKRSPSKKPTKKTAKPKTTKSKAKKTKANKPKPKKPKPNKSKAVKPKATKPKANKPKTSKQQATKLRMTKLKTTKRPNPRKSMKEIIKSIKKAKSVKNIKKHNKAPKNKNPPKKQNAPKKITKRKAHFSMESSQNRKSGRGTIAKTKIINKAAPRRPVALNENNNNAIKRLLLRSNNTDTIKLGEKIVKQVMSTFQKILAREIDKMNETKRTKMKAGKTDCRGVKIRDKRTYNARSNAVARRKNKYLKPGLIKKNYTNSRSKREIRNQEQINEENISVITLPTGASPGISVGMVKEDNSSSTSLPENVSLLTPLNSKQDHYYEYSIKNVTNWTSAIKIAENISLSKINNSANFVALKNEQSNTETNHDASAANPDFNDLKFSKWYIVKIKNDERKNPVTRMLLPKPSTAISFQQDERPYGTQLLREHLEHKKYATNKNTLTTRIYRDYGMPWSTKVSLTNNQTDVTGLKNILQNLFTELNKTSVKRKVKSKVGIMRYVRNFFNKIFSKKKTKSRKVYGLGNKEDHTLQILCENIGPCKIKKSSKLILRYKLQLLNKETKSVLKSIKTVKGLLHLLELPNSNKSSVVNKNNTFDNDIQKLGTVLKDYKDDDVNSLMKFDQKMQIEYIKKNTLTFIESVKKFADILTDILAMIKPNVESSQIPKSMSKQHNYTTSFNKIKKILYQYNVMQNTFMRRMYELIGGEGQKTTERTRIQESVRNHNGNDSNIEKYSMTIIDNLRRLKTIAQVLSTKRQKRESMMNDDALDYLLTLMEILIRKNHHVESVPANDGIDLLIDAIKNAPDIKPFKINNFEESVIPLSKFTNAAKNRVALASDSNSDSKRISNEENTTGTEDNVISQENGINQDKNGQKNVFSDQSDKTINTDSKVETQTVQAVDNDITQKVYYRVFNQESTNENDVTGEYNSVTEKKLTNIVEKTGFDKFESDFGDTNMTSKIDLEAYGDDDNAIDITTEAPMTTSSNKQIHKAKDVSELKSKSLDKSDLYAPQSNESSSESQDSVHENKRTKLEWIEETFDREIRLINDTVEDESVRISTPPSSSSTTTQKKQIENNRDPHHDDSTEEEIGTQMKHKSHDVLYEKQMDLLNSLDYGTEKSLYIEDSYSKDVTRSDDTFPAYFTE